MTMKKRGYPTPQFPQGKIHATDEGQVLLRIASDVRRQVVVIEFENPVKWFGMPKQEALGLAELLTKRANELPDVPAINTPPITDEQ